MNKVTPIDQEYFFDDEIIVSQTDLKGVIVYANKAFSSISGYPLDELVGQSHSIVRHPDMPRIAFKGLWDDIQSKGFWTGIVKNRRKDRGYYWVHATALRRIDSNGNYTYLSIRRVPKKSEIEACIPLYTDLKSKE